MELNDLMVYCESKIEEALLAALVIAFADPEEAGMLLGAIPPGVYESFGHIKGTGPLAHLMPQAVIEGCDERSDWRYRVDFLLICGARPAYRKCLAIECDGHDWHEKTKQQVARDKLRDRRLLISGIIPVRFSGSEIHRDHGACAEYIRQLAYASLGDVLWQESMASATKPKAPKKRRGKA